MNCKMHKPSGEENQTGELVKDLCKQEWGETLYKNLNSFFPIVSTNLDLENFNYKFGLRKFQL